jgi:hypothetical protein
MRTERGTGFPISFILVDLDNAPIKISATGDTNITMRLRGPLQCEFCYGDLSAEAGPG